MGAFPFSKDVKTRAFQRQLNLCAVCGMSLVDELDAGHHVLPQQAGTKGNPEHDFLRRVENCVILCELCHYVVHAGGRYRDGAVAPPSYYSFSHGGNSILHQEWADALQRRINKF